jgi:hypothetical protein
LIPHRIMTGFSAEFTSRDPVVATTSCRFLLPV